MKAPRPGCTPPGRKHDIAPASRSAQSLGRKVRPDLVTPWMKTSRGLDGVDTCGATSLRPRSGLVAGAAKPLLCCSAAACREGRVMPRGRRPVDEITTLESP